MSDDPSNNGFPDFWLDKVPPTEARGKRANDVAHGLLARSLNEEDHTAKKPSEKSTNATRAFLSSLKGVEKSFQNLNRKSDLNYTLIVALNVTMFIIGGALLVIAAYLAISGTQNHSADGQDNNNSTTTATIGGIGIADIVTILLVNPQTRIRKMHSDFIQMNIIYNTWMHQMQSAFLRLRNAEFADEDVLEFQQSLRKFSASAIKAIEKYTESPEQTQMDGKDNNSKDQEELQNNNAVKDGKEKNNNKK